MNTRALIRTLALAAGFALPLASQAQTFPSGITYQGQLKDGSSPANGTYQMIFRLFDAQTGGHLVAASGTTSAPINVQVQNGVFTQEMAFTADSFDGTDRWLEITLRPQGGTSYTTLTPRQHLTPTAYSFQTRGIRVTSNQNQVSALIGPNTPLEQYDAIQFALGDATSWTMSRQPDSAFRFTLGDVGGLKVMTLSPNGYVSVGQGDPTAQFQVFGRAKVNVLEIVGGSDIAEPFRVQAAAETLVQPGMIVAIDPDHVGGLKVSAAPYDHAVAGVISGAGGVNAGVVLHQEGSVADGEHAVALSGRVWCLVDADANGAVHAGDLITTSATPGHGMKATDAARSHGAVIGKAMSSLESGKGLVLVLVNLN